MKSKILLLPLFFILFALAAAAQDPVRWRVSAKIDDKGYGTLTVKALVEPGWHLYGTELAKGGPKPTVFNFKESTNVRFLSPFRPSVEPVTKVDKTFDMTLRWWDAPVTFTRTFMLTGDREDVVLKGTVTYMACNDQTCTPPRTVTLTAKPR